jgi:hypothetical protein
MTPVFAEIHSLGNLCSTAISAVVTTSCSYHIRKFRIASTPNGDCADRHHRAVHGTLKTSQPSYRLI